MFRLLSFTLLAVSMLANTHHAAASETKESPSVVEGATTISVLQAKALFEKEIPFVDVRKNSDFEAGRIPGAVHLELKSVFNESTLVNVVGKADELVIYCNGPKCMRSSKACAQAVTWGFKRVHYFRDGFPEWKAKGYPVE